MYATTHAVAILTSASSAATVYTPMVNGRLISLRLRGGHTMSSTATVVITNEETGERLMTTTAGSTAGWTKYPRATVVNSTGGAVKPSTGSAMPDYMVLANARIKTVIATAGAAKTGTLDVTMG